MIPALLRGLGVGYLSTLFFDNLTDSEKVKSGFRVFLRKGKTMRNQEVTNQENVVNENTPDQDLAILYPDCFKVDPKNPNEPIRLCGVFGERAFSVSRSKPYKWVAIEQAGQTIKRIHPITKKEIIVAGESVTEWWLQWPGLEDTIASLEASGILPATTEYQRDKIVKSLESVNDENTETIGYTDALRVLSVYHGVARRLRTTKREFGEIEKRIPKDLKSGFVAVSAAIDRINETLAHVDTLIPYSEVCEAYIRDRELQLVTKQLKEQSIPIE